MFYLTVVEKKCIYCVQVLDRHKDFLYNYIMLLCNKEYLMEII